MLTPGPGWAIRSSRPRRRRPARPSGHGGPPAGRARSRAPTAGPRSRSGRAASRGRPGAVAPKFSCSGSSNSSGRTHDRKADGAAVPVVGEDHGAVDVLVQPRVRPARRRTAPLALCPGRSRTARVSTVTAMPASPSTEAVQVPGWSSTLVNVRLRRPGPDQRVEGDAGQVEVRRVDGRPATDRGWAPGRRCSPRTAPSSRSARDRGRRPGSGRCGPPPMSCGVAGTDGTPALSSRMSGCAVVMSADFSSLGPRSGRRARSRAAAPAVWATDTEVPPSGRKRPGRSVVEQGRAPGGTSGVWATISSIPGASRSGLRMLSAIRAPDHGTRSPRTTSPVAVGANVPAVKRHCGFGEARSARWMAVASAAVTMTRAAHVEFVPEGRWPGSWKIAPAAPAWYRTPLAAT